MFNLGIEADFKFSKTFRSITYFAS